MLRTTTAVAVGALFAATLLICGGDAGAQTRVTLANGEATVVFPIGTPQRVTETKEEVERQREFGPAGHFVDWNAEFYEVRSSNGVFVASTAREGNAFAKSLRCTPQPTGEAAQVAKEWSCRDIEVGGVPGTDLAYTNQLGEAVRIRGFSAAGRIYTLIHIRPANEPATQHVEEFLGSVRFARH